MEPINVLRRMRRWSGNFSKPPGPERISIFLTNRCNLNCRHCWRQWAEWDRSCASELPDARWLRLVDEAAEMGARHWIFLGGGEPLVRRNLVVQMIEKMACYNMSSLIHTNGTLFSPEMIEKIMGKNVQSINFSIDGPDAATNDYIRGGGFEKAIANMRYFADAKHKLGVKFPCLYLYVTITNLTYDRVDHFVDLAASIDPDVRILLSALIVEEDATAQLALSPEQRCTFPEMIQKGIRRAEELGIVTNFQRYLDVELTEDSTNMQRNVRTTQRLGLSGAMCYEPWLSAAIMPDGALGPCCAFYESRRPLSIKDLTFEQVWLGAYMARVREGMFNGKPPAYCARCPSNLFVDKEEMRIFLTEYLRRDEAPRYKRWAGIVRRLGATLREQGPTGLRRHIQAWWKFHRKQREESS
ncbi:MAG TPA: radical SAM protein [Candidatus Hydrogenedentes bacterium]|nr:radical SAM protein [Candidatus Hydrogenedentota bacterium]